ncbi:MAG: hypothetical protein HRT45_01040 [Bdellovibrionales bacterium]|nr:hypothetical protein [Bdellovibrionales bacterium]
MEAMLLDMPMTPIALGLEDSKLTKFEMSNLSQKQECLTTFDKDLKDKIKTVRRDFFRIMMTILDEFLLNSYIHGYGIAPEELVGDNPGKVDVLWGVDNVSLVVKIIDWSGVFDPISFIDRQKTSKTAEEILERPTAGLGVLTAVNFIDHIEFHLAPGHRTEVRLFMNLNKGHFGRSRSDKRASMVIFNRTQNELETESL